MKISLKGKVTHLVKELSPSLKIPARVLFPVRVKSVFKAGVPLYCMLMASALSAQTFLNKASSPG